MINGTLDDSFYYLVNFRNVLHWVRSRYGDLLTASEHAFVDAFSSLPKPSQALLARMIMRKGELFRATKLAYEEIGPPERALESLCGLGWVDSDPELTLEQLFGILTKKEIATHFKQHISTLSKSKADLLSTLRPMFEARQCFSAWCSGSDERVVALTIMPMCDRFRLMFFGNLRQGWSEFVLAELGIYRYEAVEFSLASRAFRTRADVELYLHLHRCRERFEQGAPIIDLLDEIPAPIIDNSWLEARRAKLLFQLGQHCERNGEPMLALNLYEDSIHSGARIRRVRLLERADQYETAFELAQWAEQAPESEAEKQHLQRLLPRLRRKLGLAKAPQQENAPIARIDLTLPRLAGISVEITVRDHLAESGCPVHYVENSLVNALFGLLCWEVIFTAVPGAFFHPFHGGPADLFRPDFYRQRALLFEACLSQLDSPAYKATIRHNFELKWGIQSPFVHWGNLSASLLEQALACLPAAHLKQWFQRILLDIKTNRTGFPDLIQFWPNERQYRMIEVKGPGDRLQDNQLRWLEFCARNDMPVAVCYVQWEETAQAERAG